jgi:glutamate/tyrosine decarboxylase-like PLP-dependent enzyme
MSAQPNAFDETLDRANAHAREWLASVGSRPVGPRLHADELIDGFARPLPEDPTDPASVIDELAALAEPGLMAMQSGRFFGWVIGGTLPAALGADWLVSAWDQNAGMRFATPAVVAAEEAAGGWILDLLHLPAGSDVGFTTGATMANFVGLAAGRQDVLNRAGWDVLRDGLTGGPRVRVFVGAERHDVIDLVLGYLGLGKPIVVAVDRHGRIDPDALEQAMRGSEPAGGPAIVCLQAGNLHSGAFDPMRRSVEVAHAHGAWVHVDGAFGLWAAVSPRYRDDLDGLGLADSWATDAHKTLNVPYDCGMAIVARPEIVRSVFAVHSSYLITDDPGPGDPLERVPEMSRRARGVTVWAALRSLGRRGVLQLVEQMGRQAEQLAEGISRIERAEVLNRVFFTQICVSFGDDETTRKVTEYLLGDGVTWMSGSRWHDRAVLRISVSNWSTDEEDVAKSLEAIERAVSATV